MLSAVIVGVPEALRSSKGSGCHGWKIEKKYVNVNAES